VQADTDVEALRRDRDAAMQLYHREHQQVLELTGQLADLRSIPSETLARARSLVAAYITARSPGSTEGPVEVRVESSFRGVIHDDAIGVSGVDLLGRTLMTGAAGTAMILPITHVATGPLQAVVFPKDDPLRPIEDAVAVHLEPNENGRFVGDVNHDDFVEVDDLVRLDDASWPATAQFMVIGRVTDVRPKDSEPLRHTITVEPRTRIAQISEFTLVLTDDLATVQAGPPGGDAP
jgi:hypothetical protein